VAGELEVISDTITAADDDLVRRLAAAWLLGYDSPATRRNYALDMIGWLTFCAVADATGSLAEGAAAHVAAVASGEVPTASGLSRLPAADAAVMSDPAGDGADRDRAVLRHSGHPMWAWNSYSYGQGQSTAAESPVMGCPAKFGRVISPCYPMMRLTSAAAAFSSCSRSMRITVAGEGCWPFFFPVAMMRRAAMSRRLIS